MCSFIKNVFNYTLVNINLNFWNHIAYLQQLNIPIVPQEVYKGTCKHITANSMPLLCVSRIQNVGCRNFMPYMQMVGDEMFGKHMAFSSKTSSTTEDSYLHQTISLDLRLE